MQIALRCGPCAAKYHAWHRFQSIYPRALDVDAIPGGGSFTADLL
jgi:hypothetical protein